MTSARLALVGDYRADAVAHQAIPPAITLAAQSLHPDVSPQWLPTASSQLREYDGIWLVPGSPYINDDDAFLTITCARENNLPFPGSCGGFPYAIIEYARHIMRWSDAGHANSGGRLVIAPLSRSLVEKTGEIVIEPGTLLAQTYGRTEI